MLLSFRCHAVLATTEGSSRILVARATRHGIRHHRTRHDPPMLGFPARYTLEIWTALNWIRVQPHKHNDYPEVHSTMWQKRGWWDDCTCQFGSPTWTVQCHYVLCRTVSLRAFEIFTDKVSSTNDAPSPVQVLRKFNPRERSLRDRFLPITSPGCKLGTGAMPFKPYSYP